MALTSFSVDIYEGQTTNIRIAFSNTDTSQGNFQLIKFTKNENSLIQSGTLILFKGIAEPQINDKVVIKLNGATKFAGYVAGINRSLKGDKYRTLDLLGNTKKIYRERVGDSHNYFQNMWTSSIVRELIQYHTTLDHTAIPTGVGTYIDGSYDFEDYIVGDAIKKISQFDNFRLYVNEDDKVQYYEPSGAVKTITEANIQSIGSVEKSDSQLFNDITVIGSDTIKAHVENAASISTYGRFPKTIKESKLNDQADATSLANKYLDEYKNPRWEGTITINGDETLDINQKLRLNLQYLDLDEDVEVVQLEHTITSTKGFLTKINFGRTPYNPGEDFESVRLNIDEDLDQIYDALAAASDSQETADGKIESFFQNTAPTSGESSFGDIWFDTNDENKVYRYDGSSWEPARDSEIAQAILDAADAQSTADSKIVTFYCDEPPSEAEYGDLWVDTNNKEKLWRYDSGWHEFKEGDITGDHEGDINHDSISGINEGNHHPNKVKGGSNYTDDPSVVHGPYLEVNAVELSISFTPTDDRDAQIYVTMHQRTPGYSWINTNQFVWQEWAEANSGRWHKSTVTSIIPEGKEWKATIEIVSNMADYDISARITELKTTNE